MCPCLCLSICNRPVSKVASLDQQLPACICTGKWGPLPTGSKTIEQNVPSRNRWLCQQNKYPNIGLVSVFVMLGAETAVCLGVSALPFGPLHGLLAQSQRQALPAVRAVEGDCQWHLKTMETSSWSRAAIMHCTWGVLSQSHNRQRSHLEAMSHCPLTVLLPALWSSLGPQTLGGFTGTRWLSW